MMKSEFIKRTGFEPTEEEYKEIEAEYMGCDIDKDLFCKNWKKNDGIQRLVRVRARRIEELEHLVKAKDNQYEEMESRHASDFVKSMDKWKSEKEALEKQVGNFRTANENIDRLLHEAIKDKELAEDNLRKVQEAFVILGLREVE